MKITPIKTPPIIYPAPSLFEVLDANLPPLSEKTIVAITSKIVAIAQGRVVSTHDCDKKELIKKEADYYLEDEPFPGVTLTIKNNILIASAGIDESNGNGYYILWPENIQETANEVRLRLQKKHGVKHIGVFITDSRITPLRAGTTGIGLAYSGFAALKNYIETPDIFGRNLHVTKGNILDGLAASAVVAMGEGNEQTPLCVIENVPFVEFQDRNPSEEELKTLSIDRNADLFRVILNNAKWKKGKNV